MYRSAEEKKHNIKKLDVEKGDSTKLFVPDKVRLVKSIIVEQGGAINNFGFSSQPPRTTAVVHQY